MGAGFGDRMVREDLTKEVLADLLANQPDILVGDLVNERYDVAHTSRADCIRIRKRGTVPGVAKSRERSVVAGRAMRFSGEVIATQYRAHAPCDKSVGVGDRSATPCRLLARQLWPFAAGPFRQPSP
jgi:Family of unknown function (DUF6270)